MRPSNIEAGSWIDREIGPGYPCYHLLPRVYCTGPKVGRADYLEIGRGFNGRPLLLAQYCAACYAAAQANDPAPYGEIIALDWESASARPVRERTDLIYEAAEALAVELIDGED